MLPIGGHAKQRGNMVCFRGLLPPNSSINDLKSKENYTQPKQPMTLQTVAQHNNFKIYLVVFSASCLTDQDGHRTMKMYVAGRYEKVRSSSCTHKKSFGHLPGCPITPSA